MTKGILSDKILYLQLQDKDKAAFIKAYDLYLDDIYRFIFFKVSNKEEAEDLTSLVFLKAWDHIQTNQLKEFKSLKALFYKIARNAVIDHYRKQSQRQEISLDQEEGKIDIVDEKANMSEALELSSDFKTVESKLAELKDEYREVIMLKYVDQLSISEIARILDKSNGNVRVLIFRALGALKKITVVDKKVNKKNVGTKSN
jgi:RNA polymerase sigma-70 factor, ECF subfamily